MKIVITDEELAQNRLKPYNENIASFAGYVDRKVGFITNLVSIKYNALMFWYELEINNFYEPNKQ